MQSLYFTEEHELFRESLRDFLKQEVEPYQDEWEKQQKVDRSLFRKMGEMGFLGLEFPEEYGGMDLDLMYTTVLAEEMGYHCTAGVTTTISAHVYLALNYIANGGSAFLKEKYLAPGIRGEKVGALAMSEPFAGSDLKAIRTTARKEGDHYIVDGSKTFITNGYYGDFFVTAVKMEKGISMLIIDADSEGVSRSKLEKVGLHSSDTAEIAFDGVKVPCENLIGEEGKGFYYMMESLQVERLSTAQFNVGGMQKALDVTLQYISERQAFGKPLNRIQVLRHKIADMATEVEVWRQFMHHTSYRLSKGDFVVKECSMLKLRTSDLINEVVYDCLQMFGGYGFMEEYPIARMYRDVRVIPIYAGTSEIMKEIIAKIIIDKVEYKPVYEKK
jgi:alkylation response protein AidB-like acyl-CoA dehydrogenase